jgi:uncharacterized RDD family membrane protein YckC
MIQEALPDLSSESAKNSNAGVNDCGHTPQRTNGASRLIEFPGASRPVPEWRKQLSQRVREVQERKAREAAEELAAAQEAGLVSCALPSGLLELVPDLEQPVMNPIVSKALERLERARRDDQSSDLHLPASAATPAFASNFEAFTTEEATDEAVKSETLQSKPKLTVVSPPSLAEETTEVIAMTELTPRPEVATASIMTGIERRPVRLISDDDVALSYLDTCLSVPPLASDTRDDIPALSRRFIAGLFDLILIALMASPAVAAVYYSGGRWADPRIIELLSGATAFTMFAYMTMSIALTGRTLGMRLFSLRTIDLSTGLIPTGGQAIKRAIGFVFSLALLGVGQGYALIDPDKRTVYDRLSNTIVVRT